MSIHTSINTPARIPQVDTAPVVLRFKGLRPQNLGRFRMHDQRGGGDLSHVDQTRSKGNHVLFGRQDWIETLRSEIKEMSDLNQERQIVALTAKSRVAEAIRVEEAGPSQPWRQSTAGPLREGILSVSKTWCGGTGAACWDGPRIAQFRDASLGFLRAHFTEQQLRYAVGHMDEEAYHIHFVIAVWTEKTTANRGQQFLLRPAANPLLASYEHAQDLAGEHFGKIGLERGMRRAAAIRAAREAGKPSAEPRSHVPPSEWRAREVAKAQVEVKAILDAAHEEGARVVQRTRDLTARALRKSRKRASLRAAERTAAAAREAQKYLSIAEAAREHARTATLDRDVAVQKRAAAQDAVTRLEEASVQITRHCAAMEQRAIRATETRLEEERKTRKVRETQTGLLTTSRRIESKLVAAQRDLERREDALTLREKAAEALERGISYIIGGGIAWDEHAQRFALDAELVPVDRETLRQTVRTAGPLFLRVAKAISRAAWVALGRAQGQISADAIILTNIRAEMGLPPERSLADVLDRTGDVDPDL